ncbi:peptidase S8/S53 domain-containing protein [Thamnidium elegans]|nr:peptidase S8/S53 domain-containing protein [Thamnidium elegans]
MEEYDAALLEPKLTLDYLTVDDSFTTIAGVFADDQFMDYLHQQSNIEYIEINQMYKTQALLPLLNYNLDSNTSAYLQKIQELKFEKRGLMQNVVSPNWGQSRITQRGLGSLDQYTYDDAAGEGIHVFVLDTGVNVDHLDFEGRAENNANFVDNEDETDMGGHGTHVAGKIAGNIYGIAKKVHIHSVKILDKAGDGTTARLIKGITHVIETAIPGKTLINLSLSGPKSRLIDDILNKAVMEHNIPVFVSSGNSASDACFFSPSSNPNVFAVGASDRNDEVPTYSDIGQCVRMYAPGSEIESTWIGGPDATKIIDGTSMANPHVTGIAAILLSRKPYATVKELYKDLESMGTADALSFKWSSPTIINNNLLAFVENI